MGKLSLLRRFGVIGTIVLSAHYKRPYNFSITSRLKALTPFNSYKLSTCEYTTISIFFGGIGSLLCKCSNSRTLRCHQNVYCLFHLFAKESSRGAASDADADGFAYVVIALVEDYHLVLFRATTELFA